MQLWQRVTKGNAAARALADRHYSRQKKGGQVGQPGRCIVLLGTDGGSLFVWNWPYPRFAFHGQGDRYVCTLFRRESGPLASILILAAEEQAMAIWGPAPDGFMTFVDKGQVKRKRDPGRCFRRAGYTATGQTKSGLLIFTK